MWLLGMRGGLLDSKDVHTYLCLSKQRAVEFSNIRGVSIHRGVRDPDLRLPGTLGDGFKADQKHIIQVHKSFTDFPWGRAV